MFPSSSVYTLQSCSPSSHPTASPHHLPSPNARAIYVLGWKDKSNLMTWNIHCVRTSSSSAVLTGQWNGFFGLLFSICCIISTRLEALKQDVEGLQIEVLPVGSYGSWHLLFFSVSLSISVSLYLYLSLSLFHSLHLSLHLCLHRFLSLFISPSLSLHSTVSTACASPRSTMPRPWRERGACGARLAPARGRVAGASRLPCGSATDPCKHCGSLRLSRFVVVHLHWSVSPSQHPWSMFRKIKRPWENSFHSSPSSTPDFFSSFFFFTADLKGPFLGKR